MASETASPGPDSEPGAPSPRDRAGKSTPPSEPHSKEASSNGELPRWTAYVGVLGRPASAIMAAVVAGLIAYWGQALLQKEQNARVYTELLSQRAQAESQLRMNMFSTTLDQVLQTSSADTASIQDQLLRLELLALNFSETLSLSPLFRELDRVISADTMYSGTLKEVLRSRDRGRLVSLAKRVNGWQLSRLGIEGWSITFEAPLERIWSPEGFRTSFPATLDGLSREFDIRVMTADTASSTVELDVQIVTLDPEDPTDVVPVDREFTLSYFDFPLIDNTRLSDDQRFAMALLDFNDERVSLEAVLFPGSYATQREGPTIPAVIEQVADIGGDSP